MKKGSPNDTSNGPVPDRAGNMTLPSLMARSYIGPNMEQYLDSVIPRLVLVNWAGDVYGGYTEDK